MRLPAAVSGALLLTLSLAACGSDDDTGSDASQSESADAPAAATCEYPEAGPAAKENEPPPAEPEVSGEVAATVTLAGQEVPVTLDADGAPCTVNSFVSLAEQGYFDGTDCHRLTTQGIFVLQCGDPTDPATGQPGTGGPGYSFADELGGDETYERGTLAMANAGPDTNGSQFFMVYDSSPLPAAYTVFGSISEEGLAVVDSIAEGGAEGGAPDGAPVEDASIESVTVD